METCTNKCLSKFHNIGRTECVVSNQQRTQAKGCQHDLRSFAAWTEHSISLFSSTQNMLLSSYSSQSPSLGLLLVGRRDCAACPARWVRQAPNHPEHQTSESLGAMTHRMLRSLMIYIGCLRFLSSLKFETRKWHLLFIIITIPRRLHGYCGERGPITKRLARVGQQLIMRYVKRRC